MKEKKQLTIIALLLALFMICLLSVSYTKDVQAEQELVSRTAIPEDETKIAANMLTNLKIPYYLKPKIKILVSRETEKRKVFKVTEISSERDFNNQISIIALKPFRDEELLEEDTFHIVNIEVEWKTEANEKIVLNGDLDGWKKIEHDQNTPEIIPNRHKLTIEEAESLQFPTST